MQSERADFALGAAIWQSRPNNVVWCPTGIATWRTGRNIRVVFDAGLFPPLYRNMTSSTKPEVHNVSRCRQRRTDRSMATVNMCRKTGEIRTIDFWEMPVSRQTDRQANIHIRGSQYFAPPPLVGCVAQR